MPHVPLFPHSEAVNTPRRQAELEVRWLKYWLMQNERERCRKSFNSADKVQCRIKGRMAGLEPLRRETYRLPRCSPREAEL